MWKIIQQLCEDIRGNLTVYEAVVLMMTALGSLRCHDKSRVIPVGYRMNYIRYWQASGESIKTSIRTRTRIEQLTEEGHYTGGTVAFGYKRVQKGRLNKKNQAVCDLEIDEEEAAIVRLIFQKYVYEGYGVKRICNYLVENHIMGRNGKNICFARTWK